MVTADVCNMKIHGWPGFKCPKMCLWEPPKFMSDKTVSTASVGHTTSSTDFSAPVGFTMPDLWPHSDGLRLPRCVQPSLFRQGSSSVKQQCTPVGTVTAINTHSPAPGDTPVPPSSHFYTSVFDPHVHPHDHSIFRILLAGYRRAGPETHLLPSLDFWFNKTWINHII